ncbi:MULTISPECIES: thermonuclease family protein [Halocynthiibacter]|uniref:Thermonuclease family protein n=1 Tax=Halocynthiibacter halioticoli TaxID=2986804 RepID=A0AAE3J2J1_9RHOB|nr:MULTISPECIES: thermonuclease family protein [Halocynthiibacter]MCV6825533.1 thermonuclease family protein [Halocynthiibacter halioticoli]MCW4058534.1 thermonuclease family protein [Halocynthiibacter sp. SDUM655004]
MTELIVLALLVAGFVAIFHSGSAPKSKSRPRNYQPRPRAPQNVTPFNAKTAVHLVDTRVIRGYARIVDGDTIVIQKTQIRLFGIDAPEINHPYGKQAKWALVKMCKGQEIRAELVEADAYGRTVAKCALPDGRDLSAEMVKQGLAIDWAKFSGGKYKPLEVPNIRKKLWLADARQKGRMHVWKKFEARSRGDGGTNGQ